ncbi:hypothetical protein HDV00_007557 [Rhizophlyctis rosea]|nr:hypothetical protein HDV00_007557 [Rhizophlyctis rosea]
MDIDDPSQTAQAPPPSTPLAGMVRLHGERGSAPSSNEKVQKKKLKHIDFAEASGEDTDDDELVELNKQNVKLISKGLIKIDKDFYVPINTVYAGFDLCARDFGEGPPRSHAQLYALIREGNLHRELRKGRPARGSTATLDAEMSTASLKGRESFEKIGFPVPGVSSGQYYYYRVWDAYNIKRGPNEHHNPQNTSTWAENIFAVNARTDDLKNHVEEDAIPATSWISQEVPARQIDIFPRHSLGDLLDARIDVAEKHLYRVFLVRSFTEDEGDILGIHLLGAGVDKKFFAIQGNQVSESACCEPTNLREGCVPIGPMEQLTGLKSGLVLVSWRHGTAVSNDSKTPLFIAGHNSARKEQYIMMDSSLKRVGVIVEGRKKGIYFWMAKKPSKTKMVEEPPFFLLDHATPTDDIPAHLPETPKPVNETATAPANDESHETTDETATDTTPQHADNAPNPLSPSVGLTQMAESLNNRIKMYTDYITEAETNQAIAPQGVVQKWRQTLAEMETLRSKITGDIISLLWPTPAWGHEDEGADAEEAWGHEDEGADAEEDEGVDD